MPLTHLEEIRGRQLSAVVFVQDYVQLQFEGPDRVLSCYSLPFVTSPEGHKFTSGEQGWRDAICGLIGASVESALFSDDRFTICFGGRTEFVVPLDPSLTESGELRISGNRPIIVF